MYMHTIELKREKEEKIKRRERKSPTLQGIYDEIKRNNCPIKTVTTIKTEYHTAKNIKSSLKKATGSKCSLKTK